MRVTDDHRAGVDAPGQWITLRSGGLATSSTTVRRWRTENGPVHHLVDPATGRPADRRVADGQRRRGLVPRREHRQHRRDHPRRAGDGVARVAWSSEPARRRRRRRAARRRVARRGRRPRAGRSRRTRSRVASSTERLLVPDARHGRGRSAAADRERRARRARVGAVRRPARWPRFAIDTLHRDVSLLVLVLLVLHIVTSVLDSFAPIKLIDAVIPFGVDVPAAVARARRAGVRPAARARGHEPAAPAARLPLVARDPLARVRELAGRGVPRARHRQRHEGRGGCSR